MTDGRVIRVVLLAAASCALPALAAAQNTPRREGGSSSRPGDRGRPAEEGAGHERRGHRPYIVIVNDVPYVWGYPHNTGNLQLVGGYVQQAPPAPQFEAVPSAPPGPAMTWIGGHYQWDGATYNWVSGQWVPIPGGYTRWEPGRWDHNELGWYWVHGRWVE